MFSSPLAAARPPQDASRQRIIGFAASEVACTKSQSDPCPTCNLAATKPGTSAPISRASLNNVRETRKPRSQAPMPSASRLTSRPTRQPSMCMARPRTTFECPGASGHTLYSGQRSAWLLRLRLRRLSAARRKNGIGHLRLVARQAPEKTDDLIDLIIGQLSAELADPHDRYGLSQIPSLAGVKIGSGERNVPERRNLEDIFIARRLRHQEASLVLQRQETGARFFDDPERGVHAPTHIDPVVAIGAALVHEQGEALLLRFRERACVAAKETIERRVGRNQRGFEHSYGLLGVCKRDRIRLARERLGESVMVTGYAFQLLRHMR